MRVKFDPAADAAYILLVDDVEAGGVAHTFTCDSAEVDGMINLDFDAAGRLIGIEVLDARAKLPSALLDEANRPD